jgi:hypothetical protein
MESIFKGIASAMIAYTTHYGAVKMYDAVCVPDGVWGYVQGLVTMGSPMCQAGVHVIQSTQVSYSSMLMMGLTRVALDWIVPVLGQQQAPSALSTLATMSKAASTAAGVSS